MTNLSHSYRDLTQLTKWLQYFLFASLFLNLLGVFSNFLQYEFLREANAGIFPTEELLNSAAERNDLRQHWIGILQVVTLIITGFLFLRWIYFANSNARGFGAKNMRFTPRRSIASYFIPVVNLWWPYEAMKEIWQCSSNPTEWMTVKSNSILRWWWLLWLVSGCLDNVAARLSLRAEDINSLIDASIAGLAADSMNVPLDIIAIILVKRIFHMQTAQKNPQIIA